MNDVPSLSDLPNIADDGTLRIKPDEGKRVKTRLAEVDRHFGPHRVDQAGKEIDLRKTQDELEQMGVKPDPDQIPLGKDDAKPSKPKYDPVTGELIRTLKVTKDQALDEPHTVPVAARALTYAARDAEGFYNVGKILVALFMPTNVVVMTFIFLFYFIYDLIVGFFGFILFAMMGATPTLYRIPLALILMAHYVNTLEDTGPEAMDELPRPLRNLSVGNDIWTPFCHMAIAMIVCFLPAALCLNYLPERFAILTLVPLALGLFFFPAVLLTTTTGTTIHNLRPDRLAGVVRASGGQYVTSFFLWLLALPLFVYSIMGIWMIPGEIREAHQWIHKVLNHPAVVYPLLFVTIIIMHLASWHLGLIYRRCHAQFPWIMQRHISTRRQQEAEKAAEIRAKRRKPKYVQ